MSAATDFLAALQADPLNPDLCRQFGVEIVKATEPERIDLCRRCDEWTSDPWAICADCRSEGWMHEREIRRAEKGIPSEVIL